MDLHNDSTDASLGERIDKTAGSFQAPPHRADILIVDGEAAVRSALTSMLRRNGQRCREAHDAGSARRCVEQQLPNLILLDWLLPGVSGLEYLQELKREKGTCAIPVIMLSARAAEPDKVLGLESGADDYITKPIAARELIARIQALLRRVWRMGDTRSVLSVAGLTLDPSSHRVQADGSNCPMGPTEYRLLEYFLSQTGIVQTRQQLLECVWPSNVHVSMRTVDVHIRRLRQALQPFGYDRFIQTIHGAGYRFALRPDEELLR